jgi:hypothetical protein
MPSPGDLGVLTPSSLPAALAAAGAAQKIGASAIPFIIAPTGSMANNGALTLGTALPNAYPSAYVFLPAAAIAAGSLAGWYYASFSTTLLGTVFNNTYVSGAPAIPAAPVAFATVGPGAYAGVIIAVTGPQISVPANLLGPNGVLRYNVSWSYANNADAKTLGVSFGGASLYSSAPTATSANTIQRVLKNRGVANSQVSDGASGFVGTGTSAGLPTLAAVDTTQPQNFIVTGQLAVATDFIVMESYLLEVIPG